MSQVGFEEALVRVGMQVRGGNLIRVPWSTAADGESVGSVAWAGMDMGIFVVDSANSKMIELDTLARKDVIVCSAIFNPAGARTDFIVGESRFDAKGADMTMVFVPKHERSQFVASVRKASRRVLSS